MPRIDWSCTTKRLLKHLDDNLDEYAAGGQRRSKAYQNAAEALPLDPMTGCKYTTSQVRDRLHKLKHFSKTQTSDLEEFYRTGSSYLEWQEKWNKEVPSPPRSRRAGIKLARLPTCPPMLEEDYFTPNGTMSSTIASPDSLCLQSDVIEPRNKTRHKAVAEASPQVLAQAACETQMTGSISTTATNNVDNSRAGNAEPFFDTSAPSTYVLGDPDVVSSMSDIQCSINSAAYSYFQFADIDHGPEPDYLYIEERYPDLRDLFKKVFGIRTDQLLGSHLGRLQCLGVKNIHCFQALIGCAVLEWVFLSSFPDSYTGNHPKLQIREETSARHDRQKRFRHAALGADHNLDQSQELYEQDIRGRAAILAYRMANALKPLVLPHDDKDGTYYFVNAGYPEESYEEWEKALKDVFEKSLVLKSKLKMKRGSHRFFWPTPTAGNQWDFDPTRMKVELPHQIDVRQPRKILMTLMPGIKFTRSVVGDCTGAGLDGERLSVHILPKALVVLRP
ncbi:MAG: hypothetical protein M1830_006589 [Pleopsidium flavum]|nr:MAG: hypothetical protein M1830_006589 [Pleopsidium flavum]